MKRLVLMLAGLSVLLASCSRLPENITSTKEDPVVQPKPELPPDASSAAINATTAVSLQNNVPLTGLSGARSSTASYSIDVPSGQSQLQIKITGNSGDCDLYVKFGSAPTTSSWDFRPYTSSSNETVTIANPAAGTWYIMLRGYSAYSGVTLVASYTTGSVGKPDLTIYMPSANPFIETRTFSSTNCAVQEGSVVAGTRRLLRFSAESRNQGTADVVLGDPATHPELFTWGQCHGHYHYLGFISYDLLDSGGGLVAGGKKIAFCLEDFSRFSSSAGPAKYSCSNQGISVGWADIYSATLDGQWIDITDVPAGTYTLRLTVDPLNQIPELDETNNSGSMSVTIPPVTGNTATPLTSGVPVGNLSGAAGSNTYFKITVPAGATLLNVTTSGGSGDVDLYVKQGSQPSTSVYDFRSWGNTTTENIGVSFPVASDWYITLNGYAAYSGVTLNATVSTSGSSPTVLTPGTPITGLSGAQGSLTYFKVTVGSGSPVLTVTTSGGSGDVDLYLKYGSEPTTSSYDQRSWTNTNNETVQVLAPRAGDWYITLNGYAAYSGVTLNGSLSNLGTLANEMQMLAPSAPFGPPGLVKDKKTLGTPIPLPSQ